MSNSQTDRGRSARNCHRPLVALSGVVCPAPLRTSHVCPTPILTVVGQRGIVTGSQKPWFLVITAALCKLGEEQSERIFSFSRRPKAGRRLLAVFCMACCMMHDGLSSAGFVLGRLVGGGLSAAACRRQAFRRRACPRHPCQRRACPRRACPRRLVVSRLVISGLVLSLTSAGWARSSPSSE